MALIESDLDELLVAPTAGEMSSTIRTSLAGILDQHTEAGATAVIGAHPHDRTDARTTHRNGHRHRLLSPPPGTRT